MSPPFVRSVALRIVVPSDDPQHVFSVELALIMEYYSRNADEAKFFFETNGGTICECW
ncbi:protein of unknown function (plasmid) [Caballeronia sp. S22]